MHCLPEERAHYSAGETGQGHQTGRTSYVHVIWCARSCPQSELKLHDLDLNHDWNAAYR